MGKSIADWEIHFTLLSHTFRREVIEALKTLQTDEMIFGEYEWTQLFLLRKIAEEVDAKQQQVNK